MLSNSIIGSSSQASHYFLGSDNYYTKGDETAKERSAWWGKGAAALGLSGQVDEKVFSDLLKGKLPDGEQLGLKTDHAIKHRPGFDLTFSVPKSVSIAALLGDDLRIMAAIQKAADKALSLVERACAQARITKGGVTTYENTQNLVAAKFLHDLSREADPQLHVHCVIMNMTQRSDSKWRSLASQMGAYGKDVSREVNGFIEKVRHHEHYFGTAFDAELAFELKKLGYNIIKPEGKNYKAGMFEIEGISQKTLETYSRRSRQIAEYMKEYGYSGAKAASVATLKTRQSKQNISRDTVETLWKNMSDTHHIDAFGEVKRCVERALDNEKSQQTVNPASPEINLKASLEAVQHAIRHLSETQIVLKEMDILNIALQHAVGEKSEAVHIDTMLKAIESFKHKGELILLASEQGENKFTTKLQVEQEREILNLIQTSTRNAQPLLSAQKIEAYLFSDSNDNIQLNTEQKQAMRVLFSNTAKIGILDGAAGTGKTHLIKPMMELAKAGGYQTVLLTPSKAQNEDLKSSLYKKPSTLSEWFKALFAQDKYATVSAFLHNPDKYMDASSLIKRKAIAFVDNAQMISSKQWHDLSVLAQKTHLHLIAIGDQKSLQTFQAGTPYTQLLEKGAVAAQLTQNYRAQNEPIKEALADTLNNNISKAFEKIGDRIFSVENREERLNIMAERFALLPEKERNNTLLLMPSKAQCEEINIVVREALKKNHALQQNGILTEALVPKSLAESEYAFAKNYEKQQWVRFNEDFRSLKIKKGDYLQILWINAKQNSLLIQNQSGQRINWHPAKIAGRQEIVEVFEPKQRELVIGETLNWRRNDKNLGFHNGERLRITAIKGDQISVQRDNQKVHTINLNTITSRHFDYGYAFTAYQKSHAKAENVIAYQASYSRQSHQRLFYKTLGQAEKNAWIYTENKAGLLKNLQQQTGDKITAIDALLGKQHAGEITEVILLEKAVTAALLKLKDFQQENNQLKEKENTPENIAKHAVQYAIAHLAERETAFEHKKVMEVALKQALGKADIETLTQAILDAQKNGDIIQGLYSQDGTRWTTREAIAMEREILMLASQDKSLQPLSSKEAIENHIQAVNPKPEHIIAIKAITAHTDTILNIQGYAGVGKTTLLKYIEPLLKAEKFELLCLAPTHSAVKELRARGLTAQTLESFLAQNRGLLAATNDPNTAVKKNHQLIIAVDESSMVSNRRMRDFLKITETLEARSWIMGDKKQHPAIESGKPATLLERAGVKTLYLTDIERQKDQTLLKAVKETYQGDFAAAFKTLNKNIIEVGKSKDNIDDREKRLTAIRDAYLKLGPKEQAQTLIVTCGNEDRRLANDLIREGLAKNKQLSGEEFKTTILVSRDMTVVEKTRANNYQIGDKLRFSLPDKTTGIAKNDYLTVSHIHPELNLLTLVKPNGEKVAFQPHMQRAPIEVYASEERKLQAGDYIRWTRSDKEAGFLSPEVLRVEKIENQKLQLQPVKVTTEGWQPDGDPLSVKAQEKRNQHWDYAYVMTGYSAQGRTVKNVLINAESYRKNLATEPSFLVGITRAVQNLTIYTDNKANLLDKIQKNTREKTSALETIGELQKLEQSQKLKKSVPQKPSTPATKTTQTISKLAPHKEKSQHLNSASIAQALHENTELVLERIMGEPKEKTGSQYRYGSKHGSLIVTLKGDKRGMWHDFQTGEGGNLLHLIAKQTGLDIKADFQKILAEGARILGMPEGFVQQNYTAKETKTPAPENEKLTDEQQRSLKYAQKLARESQPVKGTLAEQYLKEHRGIHLEKFPDAIRFHPAVYSRRNESIHPALIAVAKDEQGKVKAVQAIYLDENTAQKADVAVQKQTWGLPSSGATVNLGTDTKPDLPVFIAEGPETGLSLYAALGKANVKVTLGKSNFKNINPHTEPKNIVFCLDNDGKALAETEKTNFKEIAEKLETQGKILWVAQPEMAGKDYNDMLKEQGMTAIRQNINNAVMHTDFINPSNNPTTLKSAVFDKAIYTQQAFKINENSANPKQFVYAIGNGLSHAVDKIAAQINHEKNQQLIDPLESRKDYLPSKSSENKTPENNKTPQKGREVEREVEL